MSELTPDRRPTKYDAWAYVIIGLIAIPLVALGVGALVLPPGIAYKLIERGSTERRTEWLVLGILCALVWLLFLGLTARRIMGRKAAPAEDAEAGGKGGEAVGTAAPAAPAASAGEGGRNGAARRDHVGR